MTKKTFFGRVPSLIKDLSVCWNDTFRKIVGYNRWESVTELQYYCHEMHFEYIYDLCKWNLLHRSKNVSIASLFIDMHGAIDLLSFYSSSALLAMQSAVLARGILSVRLSVRTVTFRYCVQTNEDTIVRFSASGRTIPLVSGEVKCIWIFAGNHPVRGH